MADPGQMPDRGQPDWADRSGMQTQPPDGRPDSPGRSGWSPGHLKQDAGAQSARDWAPGHGGTPPGQAGRGVGPGRAETPEADSLEREG